MSELRFTVFVHPEPQGSTKAFRHAKTDRIIVTSTNAQLKPYRHAVTQIACQSLAKEGAATPWAGKHVPVSLGMRFYFDKPPSVPKKRTEPVVKPDLDKLVRSTTDSLTGVLYVDDAQIVEYFEVSKHYGSPERVEIVCRQNEPAMLALHEESRVGYAGGDSILPDFIANDTKLAQRIKRSISVWTESLRRLDELRLKRLRGCLDEPS